MQRDAIKGDIEHVDLIEVRSGEKVTVEIPVRVSGDVFPGGLLDQQLVQIAVEAEATHLPTAWTWMSRAWRSARPSTPATSRCRRAPRS